MVTEPAVVLLDVENVIGVNPGPDLVTARVTQIRDLAAPVAVFWAAFPQKLLSEQSRQALKAQGVKIQWAKAGKNGADKALLKRAQEAADNGYHRFVVVSADADFAAVADLGTLEIIAREGQRLGGRLEKRAAHVRRLPRSATATLKSTAPKKTATRAPGTSAIPAPDRHAGPLPARTGEPAPITWRPSAGQLAAAGLGLWAAGVCVGSGVAVGSVLTRRLLHARRRGRPR